MDREIHSETSQVDIVDVMNFMQVYQMPLASASSRIQSKIIERLQMIDELIGNDAY